MATDKASESEDLETLFGEIGWLSRQPTGFRTAILAAGRIVRVARGEAVYRDGDPGGSIYGVITGGVGAMVGPPRLSPRLGHIVRPGAWFGVGPILSGGARTMEFRTTEDSSLLAVATPVLQALGQSDAETFRRLGDLANIGVDLAVRVSAELLIPQSARRVAAVLVRVAAPDAIDGRVEADGVLISQAQLAEMSNVSRNLANVALAQFRRAGWAETHYSRVRIIDAAALADFAYAED